MGHNMKTLSVKDLAQEGVSRAIREAEGDPVLISKNNRPAVWMISASALGRAVAAMGGDPDLYRSALQVLSVKLFDGGMLSLGRAAELAGLPLTDFMDLCGALHVPVYRPPREGLDAEVRAFETWLHTTKGTPSLQNLDGE